MSSLIKSCSQGSSDLLAKINPQVAASLLEKMKRIDFLEKVLERIWQQSQFLSDRFSELGSKTLTLQEATESYRTFTENSSPIKLTDLSHFVVHLIATFHDVYRCDLSRDCDAEIQEASSKYLDELECRVEKLKQGIEKASGVRDQTLSQMAYLAQSPDKNEVEFLFFNDSYIAIFNNYDPTKTMTTDNPTYY